MFDILTLLPGKKRLTANGWYSFNAVCCHHNGHRPDQRMRGGIKLTGQTEWVYACFNCNFKCGFTLGHTITPVTAKFLSWLGVDEDVIKKWSLESLKQRDLVEVLTAKKVQENIQFKTVYITEGERLDINNPKHRVYVEYLNSRKIDLKLLPFVVTPNDIGRNKNRVIIPYTYHNKTVGYTSRFLDNKIPKYLNNQQPGYVFGFDFQKPNWQVCILTEGIFDAMSINGCALMHSAISDEQAQILAQLNRRIIFVPDQDQAGLEIVDQALELGYSVSIPDWGTGIKDVNDAVVKYGRLPTLLSILQASTMNVIKIKIRKNQIVKGL